MTKIFKQVTVVTSSDFRFSYSTSHIISISKIWMGMKTSQPKRGFGLVGFGYVAEPNFQAERAAHKPAGKLS